MNTKTIYNDDDARYTDAPPEVDAAFDYAVKHNQFLTREQFFAMLEESKVKPKLQMRHTARKAAATA